MNPECDFKNVPAFVYVHFISGEIKLSQSTAIIRHIARQHGLSGKSDAEMRRIDLILDQSKDFFNSTFAKMCYDPDFVRANLIAILSSVI